MKTVSVDQSNVDGRGMSPLYISPRELAERWRCSRATAQRIADRHKFTKLFLGEGKNGMVRYRREEVEAYESSREQVPHHGRRQ